MKTSLISSRTSFPFSIVIALLGCNAASAQTSGNWTTNSPDGNSGNWSDSTKWTTTGVPSGGGNATFGAYANSRIVTVDGTAYAINKLTILPRTSGFSATNFTLNSSSGGSLSIGVGGIDIGGGNIVAINAPIEVTANQTWNALDNPAGSATFGGIISGTGKITRSSTGGAGSLFRFNGQNTFAGGYEQTAGNAPTTILGANSTVTSGSLVSGPLGTGIVTINGGTLRSNDGTARTLHNNIVISGNVNFGNSSQSGALTFSDAGLSIPSAFTLGSVDDADVTVIRTGNTALNINQAIAESGGGGQSVLFASTSGTPTVTIGRTKTATGNILVGGVNLVLANGAANSGAIIGVNGSITATGSNKFSSGALISDATNLVATDASNFSAIGSGRALVYNNGRVSFATDQTQATVASLFTVDSQIRLGLGSGSGSATVSENYNQSALGNGRAGLVSASTGTITYNGTLTAGSDNTFRIGGGLGTLALGSALTGSGNALLVEGGGIVTSISNHTYSGETTINAVTTTLSGTAGAFSATSGITINNSGILNVEIGGIGNNRINDTAGITLRNGSLVFNAAGTAGTTAFSETAGGLTVDAGVNSINFRATPGTATIRTASLGTLTRNNNAVLIVRGPSAALGGTATARNEIKFSNTPTLVGGGGAAGTTTLSIVPWMRGVFDDSLAGAPGRLVTYEANGLRTVNPVSEMIQANNNTTARIDQAIATAGGGNFHNVRSIPNTTGNATLVNTASSTVNLNALFIDNTAATAANTYGLNGSTINVGSGALHLVHGASQNMTVNGGTFAFGSTEAVVTSNGNGGFLTTLGTTLTGSGGLSIYALNGGGISLGSTTNNVTGTFTLGGNGFIAVDNDGRFGNAANSVVHAGGELRFFAGFTSTRALNLLGDVGNNTLGNNATSGAVIWNGNISGVGRLRLVNNASIVSTNGFSLGGDSSYTGGTQIEGINVTASSNTALGTGTVTLQGANNNPAALNLTAAAPTLGGLRGTDGTVTINPAASTATLTIGFNNENTVFNGVIAQSSGKTGSVEKTGSGALVLSGHSTYTGATDVKGGKLVINGSVSTSILTTVGSGATLAGTGTTGAVTVLDNGTLAPGNSPGTLSISGDLGLNDSSILAFEFNPLDTTVGGGINDWVNGIINLTLDGLLTVTATSGSFSGVTSGSWRLFDYTGTFTNNILSLNSMPALDTGFFWSLDTTTAGQVNLTVVPEPNAAAVLGGLGTLLLLRRRRNC